MRVFFIVGLFFAFLPAVVCAQSQNGTTLTAAIDQQAQVSMNLMLNNISRSGTAVGSVVASPSQSAPNYYYNWVRDAALTMKVIERLYAQNDSNHARWGQMLKNYVQFSLQNQLTPNPSGAADAGGLGEPKFNVDGSAYTGAWGRPQNDGPALRAITLVAYANDLLSEGQSEYVRSILYDGKLPSQSVIKADLEYVANHWDDDCFDLWEEVMGHHFFTLMVSRRALIDGANLAQELGDPGAAQYYQEQAEAITYYLQNFWDSSQGYLHETVDGSADRSSLDMGVILGVLHGETSDHYLAANSDWVMATAAKMVNVFSNLYPINQAHPELGPAIGRYPEDTYNGVSTSQGNPWFLTTLAMAQYCYRVRNENAAEGNAIEVTKLNAPFLQMAVDASGISGVHLRYGIAAHDQLYNAIQTGLAKLGDKFFNTVLHYRGTDGSLSEEFDRDTGALSGAANLTWSHAAFVTATWERSAQL